MKKLSSFIPILAIIFAIFTGNISLLASYSQELQDAYQFAYKNGITTMTSIDKADMNGGLTRIAMAKMLSQYAINILGKTPNKSRTITFPDVSPKLDNDYNNGVTLAYQLGIMGIGIDKFRPYDSVTRAEFGTALSRVLYGNTYNQDGDNYYSKHLNALKNAGIMTKIDTPFQLEIRGYVMLMLMRSNGTGNVNCNDPITVFGCALNESNCPEKCKKEKNNELTSNESSNESSNTIEKNIKITAYSGDDIITKNTGIIKRVTNYSTNKIELNSLNIKGLDEQWFEHGSSMIDVTLKVNTNIDYNYNNIKNIFYESSYHGKKLSYNSIPVNDYIMFDNKTQSITIPVELGYVDKNIYGSGGYKERSVLFSVELSELEPYTGKFISFEIVDIKQPSHYYSSNKSGSVIYARLDKSSYYPGVYEIPAYVPGELYLQYKGEDEDLKMEENIRGSNVSLGVIKAYSQPTRKDIQLKGVIISTDSNIDLGKYIDRITINNNKASSGFSRKIENNKIIVNFPENKEREISLNAKFNSGFFSGGEKKVHFFIADKSDVKYTLGTGPDLIRNAWLDGPTIRAYSSRDTQQENSSPNMSNSSDNSQSNNTQTSNETNNNENIDTGSQQDNSSGNNNSSNDSSSNNNQGSDSSSNNSPTDNNQSNNENSSNSSDNLSSDTKNCVDIEVEDGNSFCFEITKGSGSKFIMSIAGTTNGAYGCSIKRGSSAGASVFNNCGTSGGEFTMLPSNGVSELLLKISYDGKEYTKRASYDLTNGVFVD